jgi:hypothetical protein
MSVLSLPRFVFQGTTRWNPSTVNNGPNSYDETTAEPVFNPGVDPSNYDTWLKTYNSDPSVQNLNGSWNVYGDQGFNFVDATVTAIAPAAGQAGGQDPLLGQPVQIAGLSYHAGKNPPPGRLVDIDPYSPYTSQIFFQTITLGTTTVGVSGPGVSRMFSRWPNMARNLNQTKTLIIAGTMGVTWQATVAADQLTWYGLDQSPALAALKAAIEADGNQGLELRFASYRTLYYQTVTWQGNRVTTPQELSAAYLAGFQGSNPALSMTLGTIGIWGSGELSTTPTERVLLPGAAVSAATPAANRRALQESRSLPMLAAAAPSRSVQLGTAFARMDTGRNVVTLDLLGTFPESDASLAKAHLGTFALQVVDADDPGNVVTLGQPLTYSDYAQQAYEAGGGIVEFPFEPDQADLVANGLLQLVQSGGGGTPPIALAEAALHAETDQRGVYVDQGETQSITVQVYERGVTPPPGDVQVLLAPYDDGLNSVSPAASLLELLDAQGNPLPDPPILTVGADGGASFSIAPRQPGIAYVFFLPFPAGTTPPAPPDIANAVQIPNSYAAVRALPFDNALLTVPDSELTWDFIYQEVLLTYNLVYPLMSMVLNLGNEQTVNQNAEIIQTATSIEEFLSTLGMPVTREMSAGKRNVLDRYLALQQGGGSPEIPPG